MEVKPRYLVMVTTNNNNKYYKQIPHGSTWTAEYGRIGAAPQKAEYPISCYDTKYREKIRKGYVDQSDLVEDLIVKEKPKNSDQYREIENKAIAEIVERLQSMASKAIAANYNISSNKVTQAMIDEAQKILVSLLGAKDVCDFNELLLKLFETIPRKMDNVSRYLAGSTNDFSEIINKEQDLLDVMKGQVVQKQIQEEIIKPNNDTDKKTILECMGLSIEECTDEDIAIIKKALGESKSKFLNAWRVTNEKTQARFDTFIKENNIKKRKLLFHGSRNENWWSIINTGLVLKPTNAVITGKMFGYGTYFAPKAQKSIGYTSMGYWTRGNANTGFMALMDVAYGSTKVDIYITLKQVVY